MVRAQPPTSARAGDEAILLSDGTIEGFVGGQCAQNSVRKAALGALQAGESVLLRVLPDGDVHFPDAPGACVVVNPCLSGGALEIFLTPQFPAPLVRICGSTPIAEDLAQVCDVLGYDVRRDGSSRFDGRHRRRDRHPRRGRGRDHPCRTGCRRRVCRPGGQPGSRGVGARRHCDLDETERARVHTPVGLPIGAKTPAEIAVSIAAEVIAGDPPGRPAGRPASATTCPRPRWIRSAA